MVLKIPSFDQLIETHVMCCLTEGKSRKTAEWYAANLKRFNEYLNKHELAVAVTEIGTAEARQFIFHLQNNAKRWENCLNIHDDQNLSPFSVHGYVRTIKAFWSWLLVEGYIHNNPMAASNHRRLPRK